MRRILPILLPLALVPLVYAAQPKKRPEDHVVGKELWDRSCWQCHGKRNAGDGPAAAALRGGVPDLRGAVTEDRYDALVEVIVEGKGLMPAFAAEMNNHDARRILVYLSKLDAEGPPEEEPEPPPDTRREAPAEEPEPPPDARREAPAEPPKLEAMPAPGGL